MNDATTITEKKAALHTAVTNEQDASTARWVAMLAYRDEPTAEHEAAARLARDAYYVALAASNAARRALGYHVSEWSGAAPHA